MKLQDSDTKSKFLAVFYKDQQTAEQAYHLLLSKNHSPKNITIMMASTTRDKYFNKVTINHSEKPQKVASPKTIIGGAISTIAATIATIGAVFTMSELGGIIVMGPLVTGLAGIGAGIGSAMGELRGIDETSTPGRLNEALISYGLSIEQAEKCKAEMKSGNIMLGVYVPALYYNKLEQELNTI